MTQLNLAAVQDIIAEVGATEVMPRFRKLAANDIEMKGVNDPVTVADKAAEQALSARFADIMPGSVIVGEESFAQNPSILSRFDGEDNVWVIDPIDGTRNFIDGKPEFGVMVALVCRKQTVAAWIHDPNTGDTLAAEQGSGVWLRGKKMRLAGHDPAIPKLGLIGSRVKALLAKPEFSTVYDGLPKMETGSAAAFDYARLFTGDVVFADSKAPRASYLFYRMSLPWDHVPGLFLQSEAQGYAADFCGNPYDMQNNRNGLLLAPDQTAWKDFHTSFRPAIDFLLRS